MSSDNELTVKIIADVKEFLGGMKESREAFESASAGMKGDMDALRAAVDHFGTGAIVLGGVGVAMEGLEKAWEWVDHAIEQTVALTQKMEGLQFQTGASYESLASLNVAELFIGGSMDNLQGIAFGLSKAMKTNSEVFIENGIAASKAELQHQDLITTLMKVTEKMLTIQDPGKRAEFLMDTLGRAAKGAGPELMKLHEVFEKYGSDGLRRFGVTIDEDMIAKIDELEQELGKFKAADQAVMASMTEHGMAVKQGWEASKTALLQYLDALTGGNTQMTWVPGPVPIPLATPSFEDEVPASPNVKDGVVQPPSTSVSNGDVRTAAQIERDKALVVEAAKEKVKTTLWVVEEQRKAEESLYKEQKLSFTDMVEMEKSGAYELLQAQLQADRAILGTLKDKPVQQRQILNQMEEARRQYNSTINALDQRSAEWRTGMEREATRLAHEIEEKSAAEAAEIAKAKAEAQTKASTLALEMQRQSLDYAAELGLISSSKELEARKRILDQEAALQVAALQTQLEALKKDGLAHVAEVTKIQAQIAAVEAKARIEKQKLDQDASKKWVKTWEKGVDSIFANWDTALQKILHGQMSIADGGKAAMKQFEDVTEKALLNAGMEWVKFGVLKALISDKAHEKQVMTDAKEAFTGAYKATVGIPYIGPILAPVAGAAAFAGVMAFAEGGYLDVPSDQVAMIHKNEMVLPAWAAEGARRMFAEESGGGAGHGGGRRGETGNHYHIHAADAQSFIDMCKRNQDGLFGVLKTGIKNGRAAR
ncbi:coiled-coil domain-containing protein [Mesoterricola sediminis]|uniref:Uncharacterized protein n=1 Tax=Mesoterricola sediminis TaxID=2927980 RepID=A0AA48KF60_9BACT|nr:hypothetical protein [Mesoterricola sediminis]BDU77992.1 hypothetical protein METESE_29500 [Mesoterricola sediminis]